MPELVALSHADNGVATVTLQHGKVNALSIEVLAELEAIAGRLTADAASGAVRSVVVSGGPRIFAAGADIAQFASDTSEESFTLSPPERVREIGGGFLRALNALAAVPAPTIASVSGFALGGGLELALACDFRIASAKARFGLPEITLGIIPGGGGTQRLARLVGPGVAKDLVFTGRQLTADQALAVGLVHEVVEPDLLDERTLAFAGQLADGPPAALRLAKAAIDGGLEGSLEAGLELEQDRFVDVFGTPEARVGVRSFLATGPGNADFRSLD
ncbi:MAG: enoyl-CoA hydratase-related protein [Acidimicrobiales bacterium]